MRGPAKAVVEEADRKVPGSLGESALLFNRNDAGLQLPIQAVVYRGTAKAEPKRRFPDSCSSTLALTRGHGAVPCKERLLGRKPPATPPSSASLCHG